MDTELAKRLRREYTDASLSEAEAGHDPLALLRSWIEEAAEAGLDEPHAASLATADIHSKPSVRMVLIKTIEDSSVVFVSNYESRKGQELAENPQAAFAMWWPPMFRQVRAEGTVHRLSDAESDGLFAERPRGAQIAAVASLQSHAIASREDLEAQVTRVEEAIGHAPVARPHHWGGYRIALERLEFWQGRSNRLHDRIVFERRNEDWHILRLQP